MLNFVKEGDTMFFEVNLSMNNSNSIVSAALLEAIWEENKKDVLDLLIPFVKYIISENYKKGDVLNDELISNNMKKSFGFSQMPSSVITSILKRLTTKENSRILCKKQGKYILDVELDDEHQKFNNKYSEIKSSTDELINVFVEEYNSTSKKKITNDEAQKLLVELLNDRGYDVLIEPQELNGITIEKSNKKSFCLAQFIIEIINNEENKYYDVVTKIASGALLSNIVYIDTDNNEYKTQPLKDLNIYFDTSLLLFALGYKTEYQKNNMKCIIDMLKLNGAHLYYYTNNLQEVISILTAYKYRNKNSSGQTLEYFDDNDISGDTVDFYIEKIEQSLKDVGFEKSELFPYPRKASEYDYQQYEIIDEENLIKHLKNAIDKYSDDQVNNDIACISSVCRERKGHINKRLERCEAIWVTSNLKLIKSTMDFLGYPDKMVFPIISVYDLSTEIWLKYGFVDKSIPKLRLYENAQMALRPTKALIEKCRQKVDTLEKAGKIEPEVAAIVRYDRTFAKNIALRVEGDEEAIDDSLFETEVFSYVDKLTEGRERKNKELSLKKQELEQEKDILVAENKQLKTRITQNDTKQKEQYDQVKSELYKNIRDNTNKKVKTASKIITGILFALCVIIELSMIAGETYLGIYGASDKNIIIILISLALGIGTILIGAFKSKSLLKSCQKRVKKRRQTLYNWFYKIQEKKHHNEIEIIEKLKSQ